MVASKLTINARMPESVRVHLRWHGSLPGRVQVNAPERFSHECVHPDSFHAPARRRGPARRPAHPSERARASQGSAPSHGVAGMVRPRFRRRDVLEPSSNRPERFRPASRKDLARISPGSPAGRACPSPGSAPSPGSPDKSDRARRPDALEPSPKDPTRSPPDAPYSKSPSSCHVAAVFNRRLAGSPASITLSWRKLAAPRAPSFQPRSRSQTPCPLGELGGLGSLPSVKSVCSR